MSVRRSNFDLIDLTFLNRLQLGTVTYVCETKCFTKFDIDLSTWASARPEKCLDQLFHSLTRPPDVALHYITLETI